MSDNDCCGFNPTLVGYFMAQRSDNAAEYLTQRGRWAAAYTTPELRRTWLFVMRRRVDEPSDLCLIQAGADLESGGIEIVNIVCCGHLLTISRQVGIS